MVHVGNCSGAASLALQSDLTLRGDSDRSFGVAICFADHVLGDESIQDLLLYVINGCISLVEYTYLCEGFG